MNAPVERIELIVHPFYDINYFGYKTPKERKVLSNILKSRSGSFGRIVQEVKQDPKAILILLRTPKYKKGPKSLAIKQYTRLSQYCEKELEERFLELPNGKYLSLTPEAEKRLSEFTFAENVKLTATGEYSSNCVETAMYNISKDLENAFKVRVEKSKRPCALSYWQAERIRVKARSGETSAFRKWRKQTFGRKALPARKL